VTSPKNPSPGRQQWPAGDEDGPTSGSAIDSLDVHEHRRLELTSQAWIAVILLGIFAGTIFAPLAALVFGALTLDAVERVYAILIPTLVTLLTATYYLRAK